MPAAAKGEARSHGGKGSEPGAHEASAKGAREAGEQRERTWWGGRGGGE